jgi:hypothetical protein
MNVPSLVDFKSALRAAEGGREPTRRYYQRNMEPIFAYAFDDRDPPTAGQNELYQIFHAVRIIAEDQLAGLDDVLSTQTMLRETTADER